MRISAALKAAVVCLGKKKKPLTHSTTPTKKDRACSYISMYIIQHSKATVPSHLCKTRSGEELKKWGEKGR